MLTLPRGRKVGPAIFDRRNQEMAHGLVGYYSPVLTGPTGLQLLDLSGQDNHGTLTGMDAPTDWVDSPYGKVLGFNGSNDFVSASPVRLTAVSSLSASVWFSTTAVGGVGASKVIFGKYQTFPSQARSFFFRLNDAPDNRLGVNISADGTLNAPVFKQWYSTQAVNDGSWKHACFTLSANSLTVYINGAVAAGTFVLNGTVNTVFWDFVTPIFLGASNTIASPNSFFPGQIAEGCVWNRALTPSEIQTLYALEPGGLGRRLRDDFFLYETAIAYSLEATTASYTLTGQPVPLLYGRTLPADTGSVLLSGQTTPLLTSRLLNADQGAYAYTGTDAATLLGRLLDAGAAAYTFDGTAAGFIASRRISADTVAYLASGLDVGFLRSRVLEAGTGQYVLVASPVNLQTGTGGAAPYYYLFLLGGSR